VRGARQGKSVCEIGRKGVGALVAALGGFDVELGLTRQQTELWRGCLYVDAIGGAGEHRAVGAVTDSDYLAIDFGLERHLSAVTLDFDFHECPEVVGGRSSGITA
jgi:hypothetical protein